MIFIKKGILAVLISGFLVIILNSCLSDYFDLDRYKDLPFQPTIAVPVGYANFSIQDLVSGVDDGSLFEEDEFGTIIIYYEDSIRSPNFLEEFSLGGLSVSSSIGFGLEHLVEVPSGTTISSDTIYFTLPYASQNEQRIDSMLIKTGFLELETISSLTGDLAITLFFTGIKDQQGNILTKEFFIEGSPDGLSSTHTIDLSEHKLTFNTVDSVSSLVFGLKVDYVSEGGIITPSTTIDFTLRSTLLSLKSVYGYFGNQRISFTPKSIYLDFFNKLKEGSINFEFPYLTIDMVSTVGIPLGIDIGLFYTQTSDDQTFDITGSVLDSQVFLIPENEIFESSSPNAEIQVNRNNSTFRDIFPRFPKEIIFNLETEFNPEAIRSDYNYLLDTSNIYAKYRLGIPLRLTMNQVVATDTSNIDWGDIDTENLEKIKVVVNSENGFPFGANLKILFLDDSTGSVLDLFEGFGEVIQPATTDENGSPVEASLSVTSSELSAEQIDLLFDADKLIYRVILNTDRSDEDILVNITRQSFLDIHVGVTGDLNFNVEFN